MSSWLGVLLAVCCLVMPARGASLEMADGQKLAGKVRLVEGAVELTPEGQGPRKVPLEQVKRLSFAPVVTTYTTALQAPAGTLPAPWKATEVGTSKHTGAAAFANGVFTLTAGGWGFYGPEDSGYFLHQEMEGDFQIIARVTSVGPEETPLAAGVMIRESPAADSVMAGAMRQPNGVVKFALRPHSGWIDYARQEGNAAHPYVRVGRDGDVFSAWRSSNGRNWEIIDRRKLPMPRKVLAGLAASGLTNTYRGQATIDSVLISLTRPRASFFPESTMPGEGAILIDGTVVAGQPRAIQNDKLKLLRSEGADLSIDADSVAVLLFNPTPADIEKTLSGKRGVLLSSGDFVDGELKLLATERLEMTSVLFGARRYEPAKQAMAVSLREIEPAAGPVVRLRDGSAYRCKSLSLGKDQVELESPLLGRQTVAAEDVLAIER